MTVETAPGHPEIARIVAPNPGPFTGAGTNTYIHGSDPCTVIDPGPDDAGHRAAILAAAAERGGIGLILLTHDHADHAAGAAPLAAAVSAADGSKTEHIGGRSVHRRRVVAPLEREGLGGLVALATPGHAPDHVCLLTEDGVCFSGDLVLGEGSTIVPPDGGSLAAYMDSLRRVQALAPRLICPGHGPWITDPAARLAAYIEHREMRERRLVAALERGERSRAALLTEVWDDVPEPMRPAAAAVMEAHLQKLAAERRLPPDLRD